jgi:hypothetical protein
VTVLLDREQLSGGLRPVVEDENLATGFGLAGWLCLGLVGSTL